MRSARAAYDLALAGSIGAVFGLYLYVEMVYTNQLTLRDGLAGGLIGGGIGFFLNAAGPFRDASGRKLCREGTWGAVAGAIGGSVGLIVGEKVLGGFRGGLIGRAVSWCILGLAIGASQGFAKGSLHRLRLGLIGGGIGGFCGGFLFESLRDWLGSRYDLSQGLGMVLLGAGIGLGMSLVEQVFGRVWVRVLNGRQEGRAYWLAARRSILGLDERADVGLFGDAEISRKHAEIESTGGGYVLHDHDPAHRTKVNGTPITAPHVLRDGDRIELGRTLLVFQQR